METKKTFDTVKMVRLIRESHYEETKSMTLSERLAYYREKSRKLRERIDLVSKEGKGE